MTNQVRISTQVKGAKEAASDVEGLRAKFQKLADEGGRFGATAGVAAKGVDILGNAAFRAGEAVGDFIHDSISAASDLNESMSKVQAVFGDSADSIIDWSKNSAEAFGQSQQQALEAAGTFGNLLKAFGQTDSEAEQMSKRLVELAADLASFNNTSVEDALDALRSGLSGETEPLKRYGIALSDARMRQELAAQGVKKLGATLTPLQKTTAAYALILKDTSLAQGDFARTSDQLANSQRRANAELANSQAQLGKELLPVQKAVTDAQVDFFRGLNLVTDGLSGKATPATLQYVKSQLGLEAATKVAVGELKNMDDETLDAARALGLLSDAQYDTEKATRKSADATHYMATHVKDDDAKAALAFQGLGDAADGAGDDVHDSSRRIIRDVRSLADSIEEATGKVNDAYDDLITKDDLAATNAEIAALRRKKASKDATKEEITQLHRAEQAQAQMLIDLATHGETTSKEFKNGIKELNAELAKSHGAEAKRIRELLALLNLLAAKAALAKLFSGPNGGFSSGEHPGGGGRAAGGPVKAGTAYVVGEEGPELFMPNQSGTIVPNDKLARASASEGGVSVSIGAIHFHDVGSDVSDNRAKQFGDKVARSVAQNFRQQGARVGLHPNAA